jgi:succinate dehydrogenase / fumarate reductase membrane anchor subunit
MVKRVVVGAHYGTRDWLAQRVTAAAMAVYTALFVALVVICAPGGYEGWRALFATHWMRLATLVFFLSLLWHAWIGVRDILMDYVKPTAARLSLQVLTIIALVGYAGWAIQILWSA